MAQRILHLLSIFPMAPTGEEKATVCYPTPTKPGLKLRDRACAVGVSLDSLIDIPIQSSSGMPNNWQHIERSSQTTTRKISSLVIPSAPYTLILSFLYFDFMFLRNMVWGIGCICLIVHHPLCKEVDPGHTETIASRQAQWDENNFHTHTSKSSPRALRQVGHYFWVLLWSWVV